MIIKINGDINRYYVQTLCMIYYPGAKFTDEIEDDGTPELNVSLLHKDTYCEATAVATINGNSYTSVKRTEYTDYHEPERSAKIAVGQAVATVLGEIVSYKPSWGILTGVRPSKVASEYLNMGMSKTRVRKLLHSDYFVIPKKATLATDVAINEKKIIGSPDKKDCSVYISIPFCPSKCSYCSFVSYSSKKLLSLIPEYLERLKADVVANLSLIKRLGLNLKTLYIGGGTPTPKRNWVRISESESQALVQIFFNL